MRAIICGGRTFEDYRGLGKTLDTYHRAAPFTAIIQGGAAGADRLALKWAERHHVPSITYPAQWSRGRKAGPVRNAFMLADSRPDVLIAFPGGPGTADMIRRAQEAGVGIIYAMHIPEAAP